MTADAAEIAEPALPAPPVRAWVRLGLLLLLAGTWLLPWADVQAAATGRYEPEAGAVRTGVVALAALTVLWGLSLTLLLARTRNGLRAGEAFTSAALCLLLAALIVAQHPWLPGGERRAQWLPIFGPLALLAALEGVTRLRAQTGGSARRDPVRDVTALRVGAGLLVAGALASDRQGFAAAACAWCALAPVVFLVGASATAGRRALEALVLLAALLAGFAPTLNRLLVSLSDPVAGLTFAAVLWAGLAALVVLTGASGALDAATEQAPAPGAPPAPDPRSLKPTP